MVIRGGRELAAKAPLFYASSKCGFGCTNRELPISLIKVGQEFIATQQATKQGMFT